MAGRGLPVGALLGFAHALCAGEVAVGALGPSAFPDTEASTNVAFGAGRRDVTVFDVRVACAASVSNAVQVAFGRDADGDGDLSPEEADLVLGARAGRWFVEDVAGEARLFEEGRALDGAPCVLRLRVETDASFSPRRARFEDGAGACFAALAAACPPWLFRPDWNLLKVTRRGAGASGEWCRVRCDYRSFWILLR